MSDPNWNRGFYYDKVPPHIGMKLAREMATVTYRSGPEWEFRIGRGRADDSRPVAFCPGFLVETCLDHAGEKLCLEYDANSLLYVSKAMDMFDLGHTNRSRASLKKAEAEKQYQPESLGDAHPDETNVPVEPCQEKKSSSNYTPQPERRVQTWPVSETRPRWHQMQGHGPLMQWRPKMAPDGRANYHQNSFYDPC